MTAVAAGDDPRKNNGTTGGDEGTTTPLPPTTQKQQPPPPPPPEQGLRCPRCDSPNTKFCYYNNYSLSQPRHFCKTCRRYWTKGGALRNVPVGGGCRKNKRSRSAAAVAVSRLSVNLPLDAIGPAVVDQQSSASSRLGFLGGGAPVAVSSPVGGAPAAADYQKGAAAAAGMMGPPRLHVPPAVVGQYEPFAGWPSGPAAVDLTGGGSGNGGSATGHVTHAGAAVTSSIASSIESLSFINQDLHWKLQQQRLSTMFLAMPTSAAAAAATAHVDGAVPPAHVGGAFFQMNPGPPATEMGVPPVTTSWIMDSSYVLPSPPLPANTAAATATNCYINSGRSSGEDDDHAASNINGSSGGIPAWGDMSTFAMLP